MIYQFKESACFPKRIDPQAAGELLEKAREENDGHLTAETVVAQAKPKRSPIHDAFEWDDGKAAEKYRLDQARHLIRSITVIYEEPAAPQGLRAFVCVKQGDEGEQSYTNVRVAMADPQLREQVLKQAMHEAEAWRRRWSEYSELATVFKAIEKAKDRIDGGQRKAG